MNDQEVLERAAALKDEGRKMSRLLMKQVGAWVRRGGVLRRDAAHDHDGGRSGEQGRHSRRSCGGSRCSRSK